MPEIKNSRWKIFTNQLRNKYRLVILNDDSFAEKFSLRLSPLGLIILLGSVTIVMTTLVISLVAFTPLREYIPGYGNVNDRKDIIRLTAKADSLENTLSSRDWYISNLLNVFSGKTEGKPPKPPRDTTGKYANTDIKPSEQDQKLRTDIETNQLASTSNKVSANKINALSNFFFFTPLKGIITTSYSLKEEHFGVDIVAKENEMVKATLDGTVIFSGFTAEDGYVLQLQHNNNLTSVYKHNSMVSKKTGDYVKAGDPIGVVGNTGETSKGHHLHFELWYNGFAINPQDYVVF
ncbi:MAG: metalloendopeptidase-like rane protein [Bacteroidetes bacterium]|jgi:murein DD-endopeptidase MepM/ murein hydrolase activator NlpD|nr:metalloendopeptidase-like rane protein [Bacteroidota bacterium]